ncbi:ABC transporter permease [Roseburia sp. 499]|uniref:ABC transporter permease n=1 Tax=Roseburia sp. 499 TaxID=1261634 RepID=UPI0009536316|nr:ABC transporter permease [Roseburia sp. 499]WVK71177.1 FtsX-like permease family protein [Roseburia sp. 499]
MYFKLLKNDFKKNPGKHLILLLFMSLSVTLAVSVFLMLVQLFTSISSMYETARPPHFLQMHKGEINQESIDEFNQSYPGMEHWQTVPMIDVYGDELVVKKNDEQKEFTLGECRLDISLVKQNEQYDVLLDRERNVLHIEKGEIGVPVILLENYPIDIGDEICLKGENMEKHFVVTEYVYDGQMNSTLCSSTRFLISEEDFEELFGKAGETEYLIEAYFEDSAMAADYQTAYEQSEKNLPKDGQAITYTLIFLLSAMTDIMMAMVFLLIGILLIVVAMICLRYTILAKIEEDMREIGTMKAMGIPGAGIRSLYLGEIRILMGIGCVIGYGAALLVVTFLTGHMSRTFGKHQVGMGVYIAAVGICILVYGIIILFTRKILGRLRKVTVVDILVTEKGFGKEGKTRDGIHKSLRLPVNLLVGLHEARNGYGIIFSLLLIVTFLVTVPYRMVHTMEDKEFSTYMGSAICDAPIEVEQGEELEARKEAVEKLLLSEKEKDYVSDYKMLRRVRLQVEDSEGKLQGIHIDTGEQAGEGIKYLTGKQPETETELVLSSLMADQLGKKEGDMVTIFWNEKEQEFVVSGFYQDVTSGGRTAKAVYDFKEVEAEQYTFEVNFGKAPESKERIAVWREELGSGYTVEYMEDFIAQTLGGVTAQVRQASMTAFVIGICLIGMIVMLFLKLRIAREGRMLAGKKAMGISFSAICRQELYPVLLVGGLGAVVGLVLAGIVGDKIFGALFSVMGLGIEQIEFAAMPVMMYVLIPVILLAVLGVVTIISCRQIKTMKITEYFSE